MTDHHMEGRRFALEMLEELLGTGFVVQLAKDPEGMTGVGKRQPGDYSGSAWDGKVRRFAASSELAGLIEELGPNPRKKVCLGCGLPKSLVGAFGPDKDSADGRSGECRACAAVRIGKIGKRKKRGTSGPGPGGPAP